MNKENNSSREEFAKSQFKSGQLFEKQGKYAEAVKAYKKIKREDDKQVFAKSRFNLGILLKEQKKYPEAEHAYKEIQREDDKQVFAESRFNLGILLKEQKKYLEAEHAYKEIQREDDKQVFAQSRFNLGRLLKEQEKYLEAEHAYKEIKREDDKQAFAKSRNNLGILLYIQNKYDKAKEIFREVTRDDDPKEFAFICINFGTILKENNELDDAKEVLENINKDDGKYFFCKARLIIGGIFLSQGEYNKAKNFFEESKEGYHYESECFIRILQDSMRPFTKNLIKLKKIVNTILDCLKLDSQYEEYICHYTRPSTAFSLLGYNEEPSKLRLSTIKNVNDPTEGNILFDYFNLPNEEIGLCSFISCFTFNHDSLNQFRLYGKENNQEASGVSLIFDKNFFGEYSKYFNFIEHGKKESAINPFPSEDSSTDANNKINKLPVYRCVYMDNKSEYIKLAKRSEIDFYREGRSECFTSYLDKVNEKTNQFKKSIDEIKKVLNSMFGNDKSNEGLCNVVNYILLPLKFLIKHAAFEDEQECRIFFITDLFDERIVSDANNNSMYLEYEPSVREKIKELYLSIGASKYEDFFIRNLRDCSKVHHSKNPFRNK